MATPQNSQILGTAHLLDDLEAARRGKQRQPDALFSEVAIGYARSATFDFRRVAVLAETT